MFLPTSAYFVVKRADMEGAILFMRAKDGDKWTLPGGIRRKRFASYSDFARASLEPVFQSLSIVSLRIVASIRDKMFIGIKRTRCTVFECKVIGVERPEQNGLWHYMHLENLPLSAVSSDISGIIPMLAKAKAA